MTKSSMSIAVLILAAGFVCVGVYPEIHVHGNQASDCDWSELNASMHKMHIAMGAIEQAGDADVDFVRLMLPHHQAAIDMAKTELLHGKDPQMRRLAQEIITDQQSEIQLMQRWLKAHASTESKENDKSATGGEKDK